MCLPKKRMIVVKQTKKPSLCKKQGHNMLNTIAHEDDGCDLFRACLVFPCEIYREEERI